MAGQPDARELAHEAIGSARLTAFGVSNVAPAGAVAGGLVIVVAYAGFAAPLVVLIALVASLCCAVSIAEFARRLPSAGSLYTYNRCGLGETAGDEFLSLGFSIAFTSLRSRRVATPRRRYQIPSAVCQTSSASMLIPFVNRIVMGP